MYKCDGMPKAAEVARYVACIEHDQKAPSLAEIWELPDGDPGELLQQLQGPVVPSQAQSRHNAGKRAEKTRGANKEKV